MSVFGVLRVFECIASCFRIRLVNYNDFWDFPRLSMMCLSLVRMIMYQKGVVGHS